MRTLTAVAILLLMFSACHKDGLVPEITTSILETKFELKNKEETLEKMFLYQSDIIFIQSKTQISRFSPLTGTVDTLYTLPEEVEEICHQQDSRLIFKTATAKQYFIFNLKTREVEKILIDLDIKKIIGLDSRLLVFSSGNQLVLMKIPEGDVIRKIDLDGETVHNCEFSNGSLIILTEKKLLKYSRNSGKLDTISLEAEAISGFLLWENQIYYGSKNRELVRYSLKQKKTKWKTILPMNLLIKPEKAAGYIMAAPEDNNIYFFRKNATLYWWEKCNSTRLAAPVIMRENVAVFLMNNKVKFFQYKTKTIQDYSLKNPVLSTPVYIRDYLYFMSRASRKKGETYSFIEKLGNQYHVRIKTEPEFIKAVGQSVQITLSTINLIRPEMDIKIINQKQENIFSTNFKKNDLLTFIWVPDKEGKYKLVLNVNSENKKDLNIEKELIIINLGRISNEFGRKAIEKCPLGKSN